MLQNDIMESGNCGSEKMVRAEKCRPDYEAQIKSLTEKHTKNQRLLEALLDYVGGKRVRDKLAEMIGELVCEGRNLSKAIEQTLAAWENDPDPEPKK